jgi:alcohol dehydrogenase class IV
MSKSGCDVLIAIGGGSPIDSAKAIAYNIHQETGKWIPSIAVPTTLSVAETTQNAGFTTEEKHKIAVSDPELVPKGRSDMDFLMMKLKQCSCCLRWRPCSLHTFEPMD